MISGGTAVPSVPNSGPAVPPPPPVLGRPSAGGTAHFGLRRLLDRLVAYIIDAILLNIVFGVVGAVVGISMFPANPANMDPAVFMSEMGSFQLVALVVTWLYFALMESSPRGATVGKMVLGLRVVDEQGNRISFMRATGPVLRQDRVQHHPVHRLPDDRFHGPEAGTARHHGRHPGGQDPLGHGDLRPDQA